MILTAGRWNRDEGPKYFLAHIFETFKQTLSVADNHLLAVNVVSDAVFEIVDEAMDDQRLSLLMDSGVFSLANTHATTHRMPLTEAIALPPDQVEGFDDLYQRYVELAQRWQDKAWGFVEIDQGGRDNKIRTRTKLEALGLRPIPVYHPFSDGWDYFDELARNYDRICVGNMVQLDTAGRKRLTATLWDRKRRDYPVLWIHLLGLTPSPLIVAFPCDSCDSSSWVTAARWGTPYAKAATQRLWPLPRGWTYALGADDEGAGHRRSWKMSAYDGHFDGRTLRRMLHDQRREVGLADGH